MKVSQKLLIALSDKIQYVWSCQQGMISDLLRFAELWEGVFSTRIFNQHSKPQYLLFNLNLPVFGCFEIVVLSSPYSRSLSSLCLSLCSLRASAIFYFCLLLWIPNSKRSEAKLRRLSFNWRDYTISSSSHHLRKNNPKNLHNVGVGKEWQIQNNRNSVLVMKQFTRTSHGRVWTCKATWPLKSI